MSKRRLLLIGGVLGGLLLVALLIAGLVWLDRSLNRPMPPQPPELGGQQVPGKVYEIAFEKRYDLHCTLFKEEETIFRNCKILGFTGQEGQGTGGGSYKGRGYFTHWLVLETADGRLAYFPPESIRYVEEAAR